MIARLNMWLDDGLCGDRETKIAAVLSFRQGRVRYIDLRELGMPDWADDAQRPSFDEFCRGLGMPSGERAH